MGDIVNLRTVRKRKARAEKETAAEANRAHFGRTKAQIQASKMQSERSERFIDGHKLTGEDTEKPRD